MDRKKKIMHIAHGLGGGGKERRLIQLVRGLHAAVEYEQFLVCTSTVNDYKGQFENCLNYIIIDDGSKLSRFRQLSKIIGDKRPDILHLWEISPSFIFLLPYLKIRYHFKCVSGFISESHPIKRLSYRSFCHHFAFLFSDAIVSNSMACLIAKHAVYKKSQVIYNGFDFMRFNNPGFKPTEYRKILGIENHQFVATMVARFTPQKDFKMLIDVAELVRDLKDVVFLAIGKGEMLEQIVTLCIEKNLNNVKFLGFRSDVEKILLCSDIGLLFTNNKVHAEGISNSILESMAAGLPVIATDGGGTPEIIENGKTGFIVEPGDSVTATSRLRSLYMDSALRKYIGKNAKERIRLDFTLVKMTSKYISLYNNLLKL